MVHANSTFVDRSWLLLMPAGKLFIPLHNIFITHASVVSVSVLLFLLLCHLLTPAGLYVRKISLLDMQGYM
jgi:hypothetical protein